MNFSLSFIVDIFIIFFKIYLSIIYLVYIILVKYSYFYLILNESAVDSLVKPVTETYTKLNLVLDLITMI